MKRIITFLLAVLTICALTVPVFAQSKTVSGTVIDQSEGGALEPGLVLVNGTYISQGSVIILVVIAVIAVLAVICFVVRKRKP